MKSLIVIVLCFSVSALFVFNSVGERGGELRGAGWRHG